MVDINGNKLKSKDLKGKVLVINYWFINCKPCRMEMPELNELVKEYKDSANVKFIGISLDDRASIKDFVKLSPFNYQLVADGQTAAHQYGITSYPTHAIIDGDGKVHFHTVSSPRQLFYWMRKTINELLEKQNQRPQI
ncbi:TlpA family protein disulfide reductase [Niabella hibiscisoli]|nr:TlpA disulfide reductase family protein [Niabella hibiscisoli]MCH5715653.1 TlpA family protein disulfide reductase [Niabella hibiscisoli]